MHDLGEKPTPDSVRFVRLLPGPIERVWAFLTESDKRSQWLCAGDTAAKSGGKVEFVFRHANLAGSANCERPEAYKDMPDCISFEGQVLRYEPPRVLAHSWNFAGEASEVLYELEQQGDQVQLTLTHRKLESGDTALSVSAGWHTHLGILIDLLNDTTPQPFWSVHSKLKAQYEAAQ